MSQATDLLEKKDYDGEPFSGLEADALVVESRAEVDHTAHAPLN